MYKDKFKQFLEGESTPDAFNEAANENSVEKDFIDSYLKANKQLQNEIPDFNPFGKVESYKKQRYSIAKRILPYAASILLAVTLFFTIQTYHHKKTQLALSEQDLAELQYNTELALWHLSNELNTCLVKLEEAKKISHPVSEAQSLKNATINFNNPIRNLKIN
uniref:hypothetical protein n=1 Tax=uncultured Draconibacterium sp. TaxID=1573823 RepID=UPI00321623F9